MEPNIRGTWTNVEDEILKVAVMKYGQNQWARISSLLVRKTPKQCKARWTEWLDPTIRKDPWTFKEDERLLHLSKLYPSQWASISDMMGRTSQMCLDRYEYLLENPIIPSISTASLNETAPLTPKHATSLDSLPCLPDAIDMEDDEKEMISEARARLANTQGKKAKRKARERLLDEAKRMANIEKSKDMKLAGLGSLKIDTRIRDSRRKSGREELNYNAEIPFAKEAVPGHYDVETELEEEEETNRSSATSRTNTANKEAAKAVGPLVNGGKSRKKLIEEEAREKMVKRDQKRKEEGLLSVALERKLKERRMNSPFSLPKPNLTQQDLFSLSKIGSEAISDVLGGGVDDGSSVLGGSETPSTSSWMAPTSVVDSEAPSMRSLKHPIRDSLGLNRMPKSPLTAEEVLLEKESLTAMLSHIPPPKNDFIRDN